MFQEKLEELRAQFSTLAQFSHEDSLQVRELIPGVLAGLQRSLQELQVIADALPKHGTPESNGAARNNAKRSIGGDLGSAFDVDEYKQAEKHVALQAAVAGVLEQATSLDEVAAKIREILCASQLSDERIRESAARKAAILEASLDALITIDHHGLVVEFNAAAETMFGYRREDAVARQLLDLIVPPRLREQALAGFTRYQATGDSEMFGKRFDTFALRSDGSEFPAEVAMAPIGIGHLPLLSIYVCDATARKHAEQEVRRYRERVRSLMADLLLAEEHERRRLAVDLHDGLSQTIALANIKLSTLRRSLGGKSAKSLGEIGELITQADRAARSISVELSPPALHELGLEPAVQWLVEHIQARYGVEIKLSGDGQPKPADEKTRVILFRSIRELLINAAKHAGAHRVDVRLECEEGRLIVAVEDDGVGMEPDMAGVKGTGLLSIHERLSHVAGAMHIDSAPGKGTRIRLSAPLSGRTQTKAKVQA